jgi:hypothetical protein
MILHSEKAGFFFSRENIAHNEKNLLTNLNSFQEVPQ